MLGSLSTDDFVDRITRQDINRLKNGLLLGFTSCGAIINFVDLFEFIPSSESREYIEVPRFGVGDFLWPEKKYSVVNLN